MERNRRKRHGAGNDGATRRLRLVHRVGTHRGRRDGCTRAGPRRKDPDCTGPGGEVAPWTDRRIGPLPGRYASCSTWRRVDHAEYRARHGVLTRGGRSDLRLRAPSRDGRTHGRRPSRQRHGNPRRDHGGDAFVHDRRRRRRAVVRRNEGWSRRWRGGRIPQSGACRTCDIRAQTGQPIAIQDALRRRPVPCVVGRRPMDPSRRPGSTAR